MDRERIIGRVRKLLNLSEDDAASRGEIENAMRFAEQLMAEHCIEQDELNQSGEAPSTTFDRKTCYTGSAGQIASWEKTLAVLVCQAVGTVQCYLGGVQAPTTESGLIKFDPATKAPMGPRRTVVFYGPDADVVVATELFDNIRHVIATMAVGLYGGCYKGDGRDYGNGFVAGLRDCLDEQQAARESEQRAIILRTTAIVKEESKTWLEEECFGGRKIGKGRRYSTGVNNYAAGRQGREHGRQHGMSRGGAGRLTGG